MTHRKLIAALVILSFALPVLRADDEPDDDAPPTVKAPAAKAEKEAKPPAAKAKSDGTQDKAFRTAQRSALSRMKSKKPEQRAEAFDTLKEFPTADCAKVLVQKGLTSVYDDVRKQAYSTLTSFRDSDDVCKFLLTSVEKDVSRGMPNETTCALFAVPLSSDSSEVENKAFDLFDKIAGQKKVGLQLLVSLIDQLGAGSEAANIPTLVKISKRPIFNEQFGIRRAVVQALTKIDEKDSVDALVSMLADVQGEVRGDIVHHLTGISGQKFGLDPAAWETWWKANREKFRFPGIGARAVNRAEAIASRSSYYGLPIYAGRLVFIMDTSGSMRGPKIEAAKRELIYAINALPKSAYFDVLTFDRTVSPWQRQLLIASEDNKRKAAMWVQMRGLGGATASYDALETALDFDAEAIYFLTDGAPHGGKVDNPVDIVEMISRLNFTRRMTINAIGIDVGLALPTNPFHVFLTTLAERNYGEYRAVNQ
jgi:hypothetical protein